MAPPGRCGSGGGALQRLQFGQRVGVEKGFGVIARLLYRGMEIYMNSRQDVPVPPPPFGQSPLTMAAYGLVIGYYAMYAWGLLRWRQRNKPLEAAE